MKLRNKIITIIVIDIILISLFVFIIINFFLPTPKAIYESVVTIDSHEISWEFYGYSEPCFKSNRLTKFAPQNVNIKQRVHNTNWALVEIAEHEYYVYLDGNYRFINRTKGIFENKDDETPVDFISSEVVKVLNQKEEWILIEFEDNEKWLDLNFSPPVDELNRLLRRFNVSIYFENIESGFRYQHHADRSYFSASVTKAFYSLYLYQLAEKGLIDLDSKHAYTFADANTGSGIIWHTYPFGTTFTKRELLRLNLSHSDNVATNILRRVNGVSGYREFVESIGGNSNLVRNNIFNSRLTANEAGLFAREIFKYIESDGRYSEEFKTNLLNNQFPFITADYPVASKGGWTDDYARHDLAIVYAPSPYILVILSRGTTRANDMRIFGEISRAFQEFNNKWF